MMGAVLFDLDNTLVNFIETKQRCISSAVRTMSRVGLKMDPVEMERVIYQIYDREGIEYPYIFNDFLKTVSGGVGRRLLEAAIEAYRAEKARTFRAYHGTQGVLRALSVLGFKLAIVTDAPSVKAWKRICGAGLSRYFDAVVTRDDAGTTKDEGKPFEMALEIFGISPSEAVVVGDRIERDIIGGKKVGLATVLARYGCSAPHYEETPDYVIDDIRELTNILESPQALEVSC